MIDSRDIRDDLVHVLQHDLVGPFPVGPYQTEVLTKPPSTWYLTGFLVPYEAPEQVVSHFARRFREHHWAGKRFPEVFYDPRSLSFEVETKGVLHAKCIIVDDELALVTSANFSEAAHSRNIEAGVLVDNASFARSLRRQFETLAASQVLLRVPGIA